MEVPFDVTLSLLYLVLFCMYLKHLQILRVQLHGDIRVATLARLSITVRWLSCKVRAGDALSKPKDTMAGMSCSWPTRAFHLDMYGGLSCWSLRRHLYSSARIYLLNDMLTDWGHR